MEKPQIQKKFKINFFWILISLALISLVFLGPAPEKSTIALSELVHQINQENVKELSVSDKMVFVLYQDDKEARAHREEGFGFIQSLIDLGANPEKIKQIKIEFKQETGIATWIGPFIFNFLPVILVFFLFWTIFKQARTGAMQTFDFTQARARLFGDGDKTKEKITFADVAGLQEAKEELKEIVDFLRNPQKYLRIGAKIPRGVLLIGPPGTGKTMLARAVATEAGVPFFSISGSEFIELFVGVGASRVRSLFNQAKKIGRAIIFIDEIDSIGRSRGAGFGGGHEEREQTLNQILAEMDGFERDSKIIVMAATNRPDTLDPALLRPGRFDRRIILDLPDIQDRQGILEIHSKNKPLADNVNLREIAERTPGFSGADLENLVNEAAILAARRNKTQVFQEELLESIEKVLLGPERKSHVLSKKEKEIAAYHEAGHALIAATLLGTGEVRKVSIVARGMAAGYTLKMPREEKKIKKKSEFLAEIAVLFGGYVAEKAKFGEITTGAANDLKKASELTRSLVKEYGMSSLGPVTWGGQEANIFWGEDGPERKNYSEEIAAKIDQEISRIINEAEKRARDVLHSKKEYLEKIAQALIERETIEREEFERIIKEP